MKYFATLILAVFIAGCSNSSYESQIGSGPITLSNAAQKSFDKYLQSNPAAFAISEDGFSSWGYYYCRDVLCKGTNQSSMYDAIKLCERRSKGKTCKIYAIGRDIIWKKDNNLLSSS